MSATVIPATLNPSVIGQAEKHHAAVLNRVLSGTTVDEKQWITLNVALGAGGSVEPDAHIAAVAGLTQWRPEDVRDALTALTGSGLVRAEGRRVQVTGAGKELAARVRAESGTIVTAAYGAVPAEDLATTARVLATITAAMAEELARF